MDSNIVWGTLIAAGVAFEAYALVNGKDGDTLSQVTRKTFRVRTRAGRIIFLGIWSAFAVWFAGHIVAGWPFPLT
jgi:hypothetical protein